MDLFLSDPHLGHSNIITFERTQFHTIEEHDEFVKLLIQRSVSKHDTLYVLGDVGLLNDENIAFWKSLPCHTILIRGNHDTQRGKCDQAFNVVSDVPIFYKKRILLSHEPLPVTSETLNVHGHLHASKLNLPNYLNLSLHVADYKIFKAKELELIVSKLPKISQVFMFEWYAEHYQFLNDKLDVIFNDDMSINLEKSRECQLEKNKMKQIFEKAFTHIKQLYPQLPDKEITQKIHDYLIHDFASHANFQPHDVIRKVH